MQAQAFSQMCLNHAVIEQTRERVKRAKCGELLLAARAGFRFTKRLKNLGGADDFSRFVVKHNGVEFDGYEPAGLGAQ